MSVQVLEEGMTHEARHDLESFFWLLLYIVLRYTNNSRSSKANAITGIFGSGYDLEQCKRCKRDHLGYDHPVSVEGNDGLNHILKEFHALCKHNFTQGTAPIARPGMTHRDVLDIFDTAFTMSWQKPGAYDGPQPWKLPGNVLHTAEMQKSQNQAKTRGTLDHTSYGDKALLEGRSVASLTQPEVARSHADEGHRLEGPGTPDYSEIEDETLALMESSDEDDPSDAEDMRPNAPDAPQGLALLDFDPNALDATAPRQPMPPPAHDGVGDPANQQSRRSSDQFQGPTGPEVNVIQDATTIPAPPTHTEPCEDPQGDVAGPSRPTRRAKSTSKTKRAPARNRAQATAQVAET